MRQAEIETLQGLVQEAVPKPSPFREVKAVMDEASKTFNNADLQIAGLQMLQDYAYLQQTDPEEYYKIKDVVTTAVAKRLNVREYQIQQAAKTLTKVNQVTPQKLANTVRGATVKDAELVIQLTGALFDDVASIESAYENARQQINTFADKGGLSEDQRTQMLTLLENYKAYKTLVVER
jgi:methyl coenzyme M reductase gamma subunit